MVAAVVSGPRSSVLMEITRFACSAQVSSLGHEMPKQDVIKIPETPPVWGQDLMATIDKEIGPAYTDDPLIKRYSVWGDGKVQGKRYKLTMSSKDSTIYPGVARVKESLTKLEPNRLPDYEVHGEFGGVKTMLAVALNASTPEISKPQPYERSLEVFVPAGVDTSKVSPFMIFLDGLNVFEALGKVAPVLRLARKLCCCCCPGAGALLLTPSRSSIPWTIFSKKSSLSLWCASSSTQGGPKMKRVFLANNGISSMMS